MGKKIVMVYLVLENGEVLKIPRPNINGLGITDISQSIHFYRSSRDQHFISHSCREFSIEISPLVNDMIYWDSEWSDMLPFERLFSMPDVVAIDVSYSDADSEYIYLPWGKDEYRNEHQENRILEDGSLYISIKR